MKETLMRPSAFERERTPFGNASRVAAQVSQAECDRIHLMAKVDETVRLKRRGNPITVVATSIRALSKCDEKASGATWHGFLQYTGVVAKLVRNTPQALYAGLNAYLAPIDTVVCADSYCIRCAKG